MPDKCENEQSCTANNQSPSNNTDNLSKNTELVSKPSRTPKVFKPSRSVVKGVPPEIENDPILLELMKDLPPNYNFEIPKTVWRIKQLNAKVVALQLPEGLQLFGEVLRDIFTSYCGVTCICLGDVAYGACCVDDISASHLNAGLLIHYGHSCLIPIDQTSIPVMYVFVDIQFDAIHLVDNIKAVFAKDTPLALVSIVQFVGSLQKVAIALRGEGYTVLVPQSRPLSPGEVLGCTSPPLPTTPKYTIIALGDGRFHLESIMISNPDLDTYLYDPYSKVLSREYYEQPLMKQTRKAAIDRASEAKVWGLIFSTLGHQGSHKVRENIMKQLEDAGKTVIEFAHDQLYPQLFNSLNDSIDAWVQIACPRLSIDWGQFFDKPMLTSYEAMVALRQAQWHPVSYPMDYYANHSTGNWTPNHVPPCPCGQSTTTGCKGRRCPSKLDEVNK